jgi:hypothetical protein
MNMEAEKDLKVPAKNKALTISENRLAGSATCMNCGTELMGPFCYYCGQPDKNFMRFFPALLRELLEDTMDFDSRFMRTIKPLLFRPGKLTRDYLDGKRFRYVPPLRLYIFSSIAFFFLAAILAGDAISIQSEVDGDTNVITGVHIGETDKDQLSEALDKLDPEVAEEVKQAISDVQEEEEEEEDEDNDDDSISFNDEPWDRETNPLIIPLVPDWVNDWVNDEIAQSPQKGKEIEANPNLIKDKVFELLPATMFVLLPLVALLFKFWYTFAKKYYVEHLIFALHNHSFLFVVLLLLMLANTYAGWQEPSEDGLLTTAVNLINVAIWIWIPVYLFISLKRVYQQGWGMTILKYSCVGISYLALLIMTTVFVALLSFVLL